MSGNGEQLAARRGLIIVPYAARSHLYWSRGISRNLSAYDWRTVTLPARHFSWRVRGGALSLLDARYHDFWTPAPEVIVSTSMLDLATLRACRPELAASRWLLYFHENQFAYPNTLEGVVDLQLLSLKAAAAADAVAFNSAFNRDSFFDGAEALLTRLPDHVPARLLNDIEAKSRVLPVPLLPPHRRYDAATEGPLRGDAPLRIVWNHRWEADKGPETLHAMVAALTRRDVDFELHVVGQQFRDRPQALDRLQRMYPGVLRTFGFVADDADYEALLRAMDVVVSTARQEFQGLAILEAVRAGCIPLVPDRLAYRETVPAGFRYLSLPGNHEAEAAQIAEHLARLARGKRAGEWPAAPDVNAFEWPAWREAYAAWVA